MENKLFTEGKISKIYLRLALPLVFSMTITMIYNLADTFFVAQTQNTNLVAGVSLCAPVFTTLMAFGNIFGQGGSSLISRLLGKQDTAGIRRVSAFCFYVTILVAVAAGAIMMALRTPILGLLGATEETLAYASEYYTCLAIGAPAVTLSFIHSNLVRAEGLSKESMIGTVSGAVLNIILDPILISVMGLGALGAAIASVIGYLASDIFFIFIVLKKCRTLSLNPAEIPLPAAHVRQIFGVGIPAAIVNIMSSVTTVLINQSLLPYGNDKIAAMGIVMKVGMIVQLLLTGFSFGSQPLFGYYYGADDKKRFLDLAKFCAKFISALALGLSLVIFIAAPLLMRVFMEDASIVSTGTVMLRWHVASMVFVGIVLLITIMFQATGKSKESFMLSISRQGVVFFVVLLILKQLAGYTGIIAAQAVSDLVSAALAAALFFRGLYREIKQA